MSFDLNAGGLYPQMAAATPPPTGPYTVDQEQQRKRLAFVRKPTGDLVPAQGEGHDVPQPGQVVESQQQSADTSSAQGATPTSAQPASTPQNKTAIDQVAASTQTGHPYQDPASRASFYSGKLAGMGPEPTWNTLPDEQKHHGARKALDYLGAIGAGLVSGSATAGQAAYNQLSQAPLRRAQEDYSAKAAPLEAGFKREEEMAKEQSGEERNTAMKTAYEQRATDSERKVLEYGQKIVRYFQDATGNWKGEQANGNIVDAIPPADQKQTDKGGQLDDEYAARTRQADKLGLTGTERADFIAGSKNPVRINVPKQPSAESEEYGDWHTAFVRDNKREPNAQEIRDYRHPERQAPGHAKDRATFEEHWGKRFAAGEQAKTQQRNAVLRSFGADKDAKAYSDSDNQPQIEAKFAEIESNWAQQKAQLQQEKDAEAEQYNIYQQKATGAPAGGPPAQQAPPQQPPPAAGGQAIKTSKGVYEKNHKVTVDGKPAYVVGVHPNGKPIVASQPAP